MADVPAWVLLLNTAAAGGFGLAGTFLMPRSQREALRQERVRSDAALMRDRAADIFREIAALDAEGAAVTVNTMAELTNQPMPNGPATIRGLEDLRALLAVYFPAALPIIEDHDARQFAALAPVRAALAAALAAPLENQAAAIKAARMQMVMAIWIEVGVTTKKMRAFMIEAVEPFVPQNS